MESLMQRCAAARVSLSREARGPLDNVSAFGSNRHEPRVAADVPSNRARVFKRLIRRGVRVPCLSWRFPVPIRPS